MSVFYFDIRFKLFSLPVCHISRHAVLELRGATVSSVKKLTELYTERPRTSSVAAVNAQDSLLLKMTILHFKGNFVITGVKFLQNSVYQK